MRSLMILCVFILLMPCHVLAQAPNAPYMGVYSDLDHSGWCASGTPPFEIDVWIWVLPTDLGVEWFGFNLAYPSGYSFVEAYAHPEVVGEIVMPGDPDPGWMFSGLYDRCPKPGWVWTYRVRFYVPDSSPGIIELVDHPEFGEFCINNCSADWEGCIRLTNVYVNYDPGSPECSYMAAHGSSWGAIKRILE